MPQSKQRPIAANLQYARGRYDRGLRKMIKTGACVFCSRKFQSEKIAEWGGWIAVNSNYPTLDKSRHTPAFHLLLLPIIHKHISDPVSWADWKAIGHLVGLCVEKLGFAGCGVLLRGGDMSVSGATVGHLHVHVVVPRRSRRGKIVPVYMPIG